MTTTWTAIFRLDGFEDDPADRAVALNGLGGAAVLRALTPRLTTRGWRIDEAIPEDHGWHASGQIDDDGKPLGFAVIVAPDEDTETPDPAARRVVIGMDLGLFGGTRARRAARLRKLAAEVQTALIDMGARDIDWQVGGPA